MSTSRAPTRAFTPAFAKWLVIVNGLVPGLVLVWDAKHGNLGVNEVNFAIRTTGLLGIGLITLSLLVTPLRRLTKWNWLIAVRRNLGVLGFAYIAAHFAIFFWWDRDRDLGSTIEEIIKSEYLWYGFGALVLMIPLALTSTDRMVSRLGAKRWKLLHRLSYLVGVGAVVHYYKLVKSDTRVPVAFGVVIGASYAYRIVAHYVDLRAEMKAALGKLASLKASGPKKKKFWSGELQIARIFDETADVKTFRFVHPDGGPLPFEHIAGQYLNLQLTIDGRRVNRSYTIASSPTRHAYCEISVKKAANGYGSKHLHETWREGQRIKVSAPSGKFHFAGHEADRVVLVAGGIGITPMMSVIRSLTDRGWQGEMYLLYAVRTASDVAFAEELAYLQKRYPNLHVEIVVSTERGHITREIVEQHVPDPARGPVMLCGPDPMMTAMRALFAGLGVPDTEIHQEAFVSPPVIEPPAAGQGAADAAPVDEPLPDGAVPSVTFQRAGRSAELPSELTVLEAAEECGVAIPFECRSGICGQCKTKLVSGKVVMEVQDALTAQDRSKGLILACQARAARDVIVDA